MSARVDYLLAELRCASLRARLWQADIDAVGIALAHGLITAEQALELLHDCDALHLVAPDKWNNSNAEEWAEAAREYHANREGPA